MDSSTDTSATAATTTTAPATSSSDDAVSVNMQKGFEKMVWQTTAGCVLGAMAGIVLSRGGAGSGARKALAGLGAGIGLGSAWTRTSMDLEELLGSKK